MGKHSGASDDSTAVDRGVIQDMLLIDTAYETTGEPPTITEQAQKLGIIK
jgi:hypothetical protein